MRKSITTEVKTTKLDVAEAIASVTDPGHGAIDIFMGVVRNDHKGRTVLGITYDAHAALACKTFDEICLEAQSLWPDTRYYVAHFSGRLDINGLSVVVAVSSPHRAATFDACRYVIDELKQRAPVWKNEHYADGSHDWLPGQKIDTEWESL